MLKTMFTLAHLSDPHLPMPRTPYAQLVGKRATGYLNWWRRRTAHHVPRALAAIVADIKAQKPDHIALTGDLINISLPEEFRQGAAWLAALAEPRDLTLIPGNHDAYVRMAWPVGAGLWASYMTGDGVPPAAGFDSFPAVRRRGEIALVSLSTGVPTLPLLATGTLGADQIARAGQALATLAEEGLYRVVLIHHPPLTTEARPKRLTDAARFQEMIGRVGCELILHGHNHRSEVARIGGPSGAVPVIGVASASAAPGSKYGRARYHLIHIARQDSGWRARVELRALNADCSGCESDGELVFHTPAGTV